MQGVGRMSPESSSRRQVRRVAGPVCLALALLGARGADAGAWTLPAGQAWLKLSFFRQTTDEWYIATPEPVLRADGTFTQRDPGTRRPYRFDGRYRSRAVFLDAVYGVADGLDLGLQVPYFDQLFDDDTRSRPPADAGIGDLRAFAKWRLAQAPLVVALEGGVKMPTGRFRNEDGLIPVGEGQWDADLALKLARSLWPAPLWAGLDLGYRVRLRNDDIDLDPGDEWLVHAEAGWAPHPRAWLALKLESVLGRAGRSFGLQTPSLERRITHLSPAASFTLFGVTAVEAAVRFSLAGRNYPAGHQLLLGLSTTLGRRDRP